MLRCQARSAVNGRPRNGRRPLTAPTLPAHVERRHRTFAPTVLTGHAPLWHRPQVCPIRMQYTSVVLSLSEREGVQVFTCAKEESIMAIGSTILK
jgi:hypothetical protein